MMFKRNRRLRLLLTMVLVGMLLGCKKDLKNSFYNVRMTGKWSVIRQYGGILGTDENHSKNVITWNFDGQNSRLKVVNSTNNSEYYHLPSGMHSFSVAKQGEDFYLTIDNYQLGQLIFHENQCIINSNKKTNTEEACSYYVILESEHM